MSYWVLSPVRRSGSSAPPPHSPFDEVIEGARVHASSNAGTPRSALTPSSASKMAIAAINIVDTFQANVLSVESVFKTTKPKLLFLALALLNASIILGIVLWRVSGPHSLEGWFYSNKNQEKIQAFQKAGTNSYPLIIKKLQGGFSDRVNACSIIENAFKGSEVNNSEIRPRLIAMLKSREQGEVLAAYSVIQHLGLEVPESEMEFAARTSASVALSINENKNRPKLERLFSMTNEVDCDFVAQMLTTPDSQTQMEVIGWLLANKANEDNAFCRKEITTAFASLMRNSKDTSLLNLSLAYASSNPDVLRASIPGVSDLLLSTTSSDLQMSCLAVLGASARKDTLPKEAGRSLEVLIARTNISKEVRQFAANLLSQARTQ